MPGKPSRTAPKKPAPRRRAPRLTPQAAFTVALVRWFEEKGYHIGLDLDQFDGDEAREQFKKLADKMEEWAEKALHHVATFHALVSSGANSDDLFEALTPFIGRADIVASKVGAGLQTGLVVVPLVLFADKLAPEEIRRRFGLFVELGEALNAFGPRLNLQNMGQCRLFPLLVYFESDRCRADVVALRADAYQLHAWKHVTLRGAFVDVAGGAVTRAEVTGIGAFGVAIASLFGKDFEPFQFGPSDLAAVNAMLAQGNPPGG
jgi:hypothetical protein